jgi:hypothetical protein
MTTVPQHNQNEFLFRIEKFRKRDYYAKHNFKHLPLSKKEN